MFRITLTSFFLLSWISYGEDSSDTIKKQKQVAKENLEKLKIDKPLLVETETFILCGQLPEEKAKSVTDTLQKHYAIAHKALKFEESEKPWNGKLAIYFFNDRSKYTSFVRQVAQRRPENDETQTFDVRNEEPFLGVILGKDTKGKNIDLLEAQTGVAIALLSGKANPAPLPEWFKSGFARSILWKQNTTLANTERNELRKLLRTKGPKDAWEGPESREKQLLAASVVDYLVFGPESSKFAKVLSGFRPSEENEAPKIEDALSSGGYLWDNFERGWRKWVQTGK